MSKEMQASSPTGQTIYAVISDQRGRVWNTSSVAFETGLLANWANYGVSCAEVSTIGFYQGDFPTGITAPGTYTIRFYKKVGGSNA